MLGPTAYASTSSTPSIRSTTSLCYVPAASRCSSHDVTHRPRADVHNLLNDMRVKNTALMHRQCQLYTDEANQAKGEAGAGDESELSEVSDLPEEAESDEASGSGSATTVGVVDDDASAAVGDVS
ncbi:hypothetical protein RIF29_38787 [Crotalaria pallida]|uniref:Uncharacterized protein n=1 Tax=Crotalaria pallida TaxID=3830 RepID=A0AAN9E2G3_CROPI